MVITEKGNQLEANQRVSNNEDAWFTLAGETFHHLHLLAQSPQPEFSEEPMINHKLQAGTIPDHLVAMRIERFGPCNVGGGHSVLAETLPAVTLFAIELGAPKDDERQIDVWIDKYFNKMLRLHKSSLRTGPLEFEQAIADHNDTRVSLKEFS